MKDVLIVMGSDSDLPVMSLAAKLLDEFEISYDLTIVSAHRTPERLTSYGNEASEKGYKIIIAGAGGAAHLPGMLASHSVLPVIGVPIKSASLSGVDSLYSIVQMPPGIPVATMAINGGLNAGLMAATILGATNSAVKDKVAAYKENLNQQVLAKAQNLEEIGYAAYLKKMKL